VRCAIDPFLMAHLWRSRNCAIEPARLREKAWRKGARHCSFSNGAPMAHGAQIYRVRSSSERRRRPCSLESRPAAPIKTDGGKPSRRTVPRQRLPTRTGERQNPVRRFRLGHRVPDLRAAVGAFIGEVDLRHAPMRCDVLDVHRQAYTAWADHEGWFGVVMTDIGWHVAPQQGIQSVVPDPKPAYASAAAIIMFSSEHRGNDRAFPACVTNLHDRLRHK
jgi:hypothetical protein